MSLVEQARLKQERHTKKIKTKCVLAKELTRVFTGDQLEDAVELLKLDDVIPQIKFDLFTSAGCKLSDSTIRLKMREGCPCDWCKETWLK